MRVVLDTNILISACLKPGGLEAQVVSMVRSGRIEACVTPEVLTEYRDVLLREKFRAVRERAEQLLAAFEACAVAVPPGEPVAAASDEDDNRFLECAASGNAAYLITGNLRHYPAAWTPTNIVNARSFIDGLPAVCEPGR